MKVIEWEQVLNQLETYNIIKQYKKAKTLIERGNFKNVQLKKREPKHLNIYYFRITLKYRAFAKMRENTLEVFEISDHQ